jgi:Amidohydrolase
LASRFFSKVERESAAMTKPEYNVTGQDYSERGHLRYQGPPIVDFHSHVMRVLPAEGKSTTEEPLAQAATMFEVAAEFGIDSIYTMCPPEDIAPLRERFGSRIGFNGTIHKKKIDDPDDTAYRLLDDYLAAGVVMLKFWSAPRGRERGLFVDAPWRIETVRRASAAGIRLFMVHVSDPDVWFNTVYTDVEKFGTKPSQYIGLEHMLQLFPNVKWIAAHMGGDPEHPDHLQDLLERYPHLHFDTSATKWQVREVSPRARAIRDVIVRHPDRFLFGSDLVTRHGLVREHYVSRYWCQRTLWESPWEGRSPIADPDFKHEPNEPETPLLHGVNLPAEVLRQVYSENAARLFGSSKSSDR